MQSTTVVLPLSSKQGDAHVYNRLFCGVDTAGMIDLLFLEMVREVVRDTARRCNLE